MQPFFLALLLTAALGVPHASNTIRKVLVGTGNISDVTIASQEPGETIVRPTTFSGFSAGLSVTHVFEWGLYVAAGAPNASHAERGSLAISSDGRTWTAVVSSQVLCPVGLSVAFGQGRAVIACSQSLVTRDGNVNVILGVDTTNPIVVANGVVGLRSLEAATGLTSLTAARAVAYSDLLLRFVAVGPSNANPNQLAVVFSDDGLSWKSAGVSGAENLLASDVTYAEDIGFYISTIPSSAATQGVVLFSPTGTSFTPLQADTATTEVSSITYSPPARRWFAFSDGEASKKRLAEGAIPPADPIENFISGDGQELTVDFPPLADGSPAVTSIAVTRYLPLPNEIFIGGSNQIARGNFDASQIGAVSPCPDGASNCDGPIPAPVETVAKRVGLGPPGGGPGGGGDEGSENLNTTGGLLVVYGVSAPQIVDRNPPAAVSGTSVNASIVVDAGSTLSINSALRVKLPEDYFLQLGSINAYGANVSVGSAAVVEIDTNFFLGGSSFLNVADGATVNISRSLVIESSAALSISPVVGFNVSSISIVVANYGALRGTFGGGIFFSGASSGASLKRVAVEQNGVTCEATLGDPVANYGSTTLTVTATVKNECAPTSKQGSSSSLSTGAIIGIAIGGVVGGILIAVAVILISKFLIARHTATANAAITMNNVNNVSSPMD